ncbi:hypothetical protein DFH09DRAFT_1505188 [Mycena vulgaris]|nr:hypothetical protein DFH09DRAFT_1505188 [Mycena vulgaris]
MAQRTVNHRKCSGRRGCTGRVARIDVVDCDRLYTAAPSATGESDSSGGRNMRMSVTIDCVWSSREQKGDSSDLEDIMLLSEQGQNRKNCSESHGRVGAVLRKIYDKRRPESGKAIHPTLKTGYRYLRRDMLRSCVSIADRGAYKNWDEIPDWGLTKSRRPFGLFAGFDQFWGFWRFECLGISNIGRR